jgi:pyridoxal biosynthesis lyase PdxS
LKKRGFTVPRSRIETWIEEGVTLSRIKEVSIFVSDWADNPTGALIDAIENKREVSPEVLEAAASSEAAILQVAEEAKRQREEEEWLAAEVARIGPEGMKKIREQAEAECKNNWVYQKTEIEAIKQSIVDSKVKEMLLSQRQ